MENLDFLIGNWKTSGEVEADGPNPAIVFQGTDTYEWMLDKNFILHKVDVKMGDANVQAVEIIGGFDRNSNTFKMRSFDNQGTFTEMDGHLDENGVLQISGPNMRSQLRRQSKNFMTADWQRLVNANWIPWMNLQLTK
jgi:hypothetical protein